MLDEKINLSWNKFGETVEKAFKDLGSSGDFSDVTLAGADGQCVKAHRVVLSSCSPVLKALLLNLSHTHPLLYMRGMDMEDIGLLLKFIYTGEVSLEKEKLESFLDLGNELQISGLIRSPEKEKNSDCIRNEEKEVINIEDTDNVVSGEQTTVAEQIHLEDETEAFEESNASFSNPHQVRPHICHFFSTQIFLHANLEQKQHKFRYNSFFAEI